MTDAPKEPTPAPSFYSSATPPPPVGSERAPETPQQSSLPPEPPKPEAPKPGANLPKRSAPVGIIAALAVGALVGGVSGAGVSMWAAGNNGSNPAGEGATPTSITVNDPSHATTITAVAAKASPSVVTINVTGGTSAGTGSGIVLSKDGYVLTNTHVVTLGGASADGAITVKTNDGRLLPAKLVGTDPIVDLAVIKIDDVSDLQPAEFADSSKLNVGDTTVAIGAPLGLSGTVTNGIVSALNRSISVASAAVPENAGGGEKAPAPNSSDPFDFWNFDIPGQDNSATQASSTISLSVIQTDAAINQGNSGGPLLDANGRVIGVNVAIARAGGSEAAGSIGVGFAVPSLLAQRIAKELIEDGTASHGLLGAGVAENQSNATTVGATISEITNGGAAEGGGLKVGDVITKLDGIPITDTKDLIAQVRVQAAGAKVDVTYLRGGDAGTTTVTLGELK